MPDYTVKNFDEKSCELVSELLEVFAHPVRMKLFCCLAEGSKTVTQLADYLSITMQNASQHLRIMRDKGAVTTKKEGQNVYYKIANENFIKGLEFFRAATIEYYKNKMKIFD